MKVKEVSSLVGKMIRFDDGMDVLMTSGGIGNDTTFVFKRLLGGEWERMSVQEAMPIMLELAKAKYSQESQS